MKTCSKCHANRPLDEFIKDKRRKDGRGSWCVPCNRAYLNALYRTPKAQASKKAYYKAHKERLLPASRARWAKNKAAYKVAADKWRAENRPAQLAAFKARRVDYRVFIDSLKEGKPCLDCGGLFPPFCMEFDHVRGDKRFALGKMTNHRRDAVLEEIAKCELVCCACHRVRTQARNTHGEHKWKYGTWSRDRQASFHAWVGELKANPCTDCGQVLRPEAMDFDHVRGSKVQSISSMWSWSRARVLEEIAKCELVCANCHRVRTQARNVEELVA